MSLKWYFAALVLAAGLAVQNPSVLHIRIVLGDSGAEPVRRHALLISDEPVTAAPRRVTTGIDGTVDVRLRPGTYTIESERAFPSRGKSYEWRASVTIVAGRDDVLELNAGNAEIGTASVEAGEIDLESVFDAWNDSVVAVWSETSWGLGFIVDDRGLIVTDARVIGPSTFAEVQLTPAVKVEARVLVVDQPRGVAVLWVNPQATASLRPVRLKYAQGATAPATAGERVAGVGRPLFGPKFMTRAKVGRVGTRRIESDIIVDRGSGGSPVFTGDGQVIGITTVEPRREDGSAGAPGVIRIDEARDAIARAIGMTAAAAPPGGTPLPVEPSRGFPAEALAKASEGRAGNLSAYQVPAADFDVSLITPVQTYGARVLAERARGSVRGGRTGAGQGPLRALDDFNNWAEYVESFPPVLLVRVTPKLVEGFWAAVGRAAASTQGVALPASKHFKAGLARLQVFCGTAAVSPIHRFKIEQSIGVAVSKEAIAKDRVYEGLYVIDPAALGPHCGTARLVLFSEKAPDKGDARGIDPRLLEQIRQDFTPWRAAPQLPGSSR